MCAQIEERLAGQPETLGVAAPSSVQKDLAPDRRRMNEGGGDHYDVTEGDLCVPQLQHRGDPLGCFRQIARFSDDDWSGGDSPAQPVSGSVEGLQIREHRDAADRRPYRPMLHGAVEQRSNRRRTAVALEAEREVLVELEEALRELSKIPHRGCSRGVRQLLQGFQVPIESRGSRRCCSPHSIREDGIVQSARTTWGNLGSCPR